jgi:hypothetical protein
LFRFAISIGKSISLGRLAKGKMLPSCTEMEEIEYGRFSSYIARQS